jgi:hypothetical protein
MVKIGWKAEKVKTMLAGEDVIIERCPVCEAQANYIEAWACIPPIPPSLRVGTPFQRNLVRSVVTCVEIYPCGHTVPRTEENNGHVFWVAVQMAGPTFVTWHPPPVEEIALEMVECEGCDTKWPIPPGIEKEGVIEALCSKVMWSRSSGRLLCGPCAFKDQMR